MIGHLVSEVSLYSPFDVFHAERFHSLSPHARELCQLVVMTQVPET